MRLLFALELRSDLLDPRAMRGIVWLQLGRYLKGLQRLRIALKFIATLALHFVIIANARLQLYGTCKALQCLLVLFEFVEGFSQPPTILINFGSQTDGFLKRLHCLLVVLQGM